MFLTYKWNLTPVVSSKAHDDIRAKYENAINKKLEYVKKWDKAAHTELKKILGNNCFKNCGICPSNPEQLKSTYELEDNDPHRSVATHRTDICTGDENGNSIEINGHQYHKVYTDGSAENGRSRELARAGWGVFHSKTQGLTTAQSCMDQYKLRTGQKSEHFSMYSKPWKRLSTRWWTAKVW